MIQSASSSQRNQTGDSRGPSSEAVARCAKSGRERMSSRRRRASPPSRSKWLPVSRTIFMFSTEAVDAAVLRADDDAARGDGGRGRDGRAEVELLHGLAREEVERVKPPVVRADEDTACGERGRGVNARLRGELPDYRAVARINAVDDLVAAADDDARVNRARRRVERKLPVGVLVAPADY